MLARIGVEGGAVVEVRVACAGVDMHHHEGALVMPKDERTPILFFGNDWAAENRTSSHHIARWLARDMNEGIGLAQEYLDSGGALKKLRALQAFQPSARA